jgi:hypothetical protein
MKNNLFDFEDLSIEKKTISERMSKPIPLEKYIILCEKEEIVSFFSEHIPFAYAPRRIDSGRERGNYTVRIKIEQIKADRGVFQDKNTIESFKNKIDSVCKLWRFSAAYAIYERTCETQAAVILGFNKKYKEQITVDYNKNIAPFYQKKDTEKPAVIIKKNLYKERIY